MQLNRRPFGWLRLLCALTILPAALSARATEYHGQVFYHGVPVPGATVTVSQGSKHFAAISDRQGLYEFPDLADGKWEIKIEMRGFSTLDAEVTVAPNSPQGSWELRLLELGQMLSRLQVIKPESKLP